MALKFLNKKGWHTGSLRNIENVWKAEQKHDAEEKKLDELRKQIQEERERNEFRLLQEQAGLVPRQERLDFLYESGLAVGKSSESFKELAAPPAAPAAPPVEASSSKAAVPGALFEDKPQSANDSWRKLHSDPLLLIRQREKEALDRIKNNPMKMAMIRKSAESEKKSKGDKKDKQEKKDRKRKHKLKHEKHSSNVSSDSEEARKYAKDSRKRDPSKSKRHRHRSKNLNVSSDSEEISEYAKDSRKSEHPSKSERHRHRSKRERHASDVASASEDDRGGKEGKKSDRSDTKHVGGEEHRRMGYQTQTQVYHGYNHQRNVPKMTEEEREARLREMQLDAEVHEEQRFKRLKKAADDDAREAVRDSSSSHGKNFLNAAQGKIYGTEKGGSSTIEESIRRRAYYSQGGSAAHERNAFRR